MGNIIKSGVIMKLYDLKKDEVEVLDKIIKKLENYSHSVICFEKSFDPLDHRRCKKQLTLEKRIAFEISRKLNDFHYGYNLYDVVGLEDIIYFSQKMLDNQVDDVLYEYMIETLDFLDEFKWG